MKILHINTYFAAGGFYANLYDRQIELGHEIKVFLPVAKKEKIKFNYEKYVDINRIYRKVDRLFFFPKHYKILRKAKQIYSDTQIDLIHAHSLISNGYVARGLSKRTGIPYIVAVRDTDINFFIKKLRFLKPLARNILTDASKIIFLSPGYREETLKLLFSLKKQASIMEKSKIIPNGIDKFWFCNLANESARYDKSNVRIITVGQVCQRKNQITVCKAIELLQKEGYNISYNVVGNCIDKKLLLKILKYPFVHHIAYVNKEKLIRYYRSSHVFVLPSLTETFGLVYGEALSQGLPIIYSKGQGFDGQFKEGLVGYHVDARNPVDIAEKIKKVLDHYSLLSSNCISLVKKFEWELIAKEYETIYEDCIKITTLNEYSPMENN